MSSSSDRPEPPSQDKAAREVLKVRGGVVNRTEASQDNARGKHGNAPAPAQGKRPDDQERGRKAQGGDKKDPVLDPANAPRKPPPGTGGTDGAPMG